MKIIAVIALSLIMAGCSLLGSKSKRTPEVVASCFSDGEDQEAYCKAQRTNEEGKIVVTRCIGTKNQEAKLELRGKCVEKICSEGSNTDCHTRGDFAVLEQYAELATAKLFSSEDSVKKKGAKSTSKGRERSLASVAPPVLAPEVPSGAVTASNEVVAAASAPGAAVSSGAAAVPDPQASAAKKDSLVEKKPTEAPAMNLVLKPAKKSRSVAHASKASEKGFKRVCVSKSEATAPQILRGKCAVRTCAKGKCTYQGRKEMFDWVASNKSID